MVAIEVFHAEAAFHHQKHLVFMLVMMEDELALKLTELHHLAVQFGGDVRLPVFRDLGEFVGDIDFIHAAFSESGSGCPDSFETKLVAETKPPAFTGGSEIEHIQG